MGGESIVYDAIGNPTTYRGASLAFTGRRLQSYAKNGTLTSYRYDADGIRTQKTVGNTRHEYESEGGKIYREQIFEGNTLQSDLRYFYDAAGRPAMLQVISGSGGSSVYYYGTNTQGDVIAMYDSDGNLCVSYLYDAWGNLLSAKTYTHAGATARSLNSLLYRGYYFDSETGFYYVSSRYYDPEIGRWISPEPNMYAGVFDSGSGLVGYNVYAYCANNPVNFSDPTGEFILTALIVGVVAGAVIGGAIGGTVAYNSAKSSGLEGSDLFWATAGGVGKGALIGGVAGGLVGATGGVVAAYGATSVAGTAMITATATITAKATEVTALQAKKSTNDGDNGWQIANDCIDSIFGNGGKIISPALTKAGTTSATYVATDLIKHKVVPLGFNTFLHSTGGKVLPYGFAAYAWGHTAYSIFCTDPIARANQRGYGLR